jgi:hypothetical protein
MRAKPKKQYANNVRLRQIVNSEKMFKFDHIGAIQVENRIR